MLIGRAHRAYNFAQICANDSAALCSTCSLLQNELAARTHQLNTNGNNHLQTVPMKFVVAHAAVIAAVASISTQHQVHGAIIPSDYHNRQFAVEARCPKDTFASSINISHANGTRFECTNTFALGGRLAWGENKASPVGGGDIYDDLECPQGMLVASMKCEDGDKQCALPKIQCKQAVQKAFGGMSLARRLTVFVK